MQSGGPLIAKAAMMHREGRLRGHRAARELRRWRAATRGTNAPEPVISWTRHGVFTVEAITPSGRCYSVRVY